MIYVPECHEKNAAKKRQTCECSWGGLGVPAT